MKRMLGLVLALAVMAGMSMPTFAQEKGKDEAKKSDTAKKEEPKKAAKKTAKKGAKKGDKKEDKKDEKKST